MPLPSNEVLFSVLVLTIPSRVEKYWMPLYAHLEKQINDIGAKVEVLTLADNKAMTIGEKRQALLDISRGKWVGFLDDDDWVADDYLVSLQKAMQERPADVITFEQDCIVNNDKFKVNFRVGNPHEPYVANSGQTLIRRPPYHMCFWHRKIAKNVKFRPSSYGEDLDWISRMLPYVTSETHLDKVLHYYRYSDATSESIQYATQRQ